MIPDVSAGGSAGRAGVVPGIMVGVVVAAVGLDKAVLLSSAADSDAATAPACGGTNV